MHKVCQRPPQGALVLEVVFGTVSQRLVGSSPGEGEEPRTCSWRLGPLVGTQEALGAASQGCPRLSRWPLAPVGGTSEVGCSELAGALQLPGARPLCEGGPRHKDSLVLGRKAPRSVTNTAWDPCQAHSPSMAALCAGYSWAGVSRKTMCGPGARQLNEKARALETGVNGFPAESLNPALAADRGPAPAIPDPALSRALGPGGSAS